MFTQIWTALARLVSLREFWRPPVSKSKINSPQAKHFRTNRITWQLSKVTPKPIKLWVWAIRIMPLQIWNKLRLKFQKIIWAQLKIKNRRRTLVLSKKNLLLSTKAKQAFLLAPAVRPLQTRKAKWEDGPQKKSNDS